MAKKIHARTGKRPIKNLSRILYSGLDFILKSFMTECQVWVVRYCVWNLVLILFIVDVIFSIVEPIPANPGYKKYGCYVVTFKKDQNMCTFDLI